MMTCQSVSSSASSCRLSVQRGGKAGIVQVVARRTLRQFWEDHPDAEKPLRSWYATVDRAEWATPADVKAHFGPADFVGDNRVIVNIGGNKYRLIVHVSYTFKRV
jgi:mRNA interferase HigB